MKALVENQFFPYYNSKRFHVHRIHRYSVHMCDKRPSKSFDAIGEYWTESKNHFILSMEREYVFIKHSQHKFAQWNWYIMHDVLLSVWFSCIACSTMMMKQQTRSIFLLYVSHRHHHNSIAPFQFKRNTPILCMDNLIRHNVVVSESILTAALIYSQRSSASLIVHRWPLIHTHT